MYLVKHGIVPYLHKVIVQAVQVDAVPVVVVASKEATVVPQVVGLQIDRQADKLLEV